MGVAAQPPRFRKSSLGSRPEGFNRITHTAGFGTNFKVGSEVRFSFELVASRWRTFAGVRSLPCIMPFEVGIFTKESNMET